MARGSRYTRYGGGDPLAPPVDIAEALDAIGEDVMAGYSPERALQEFLRRGGSEGDGLDEADGSSLNLRPREAEHAGSRPHGRSG